MNIQVKNFKFYLQAKLGQRGAEMVEYALVLACVCAIGATIYGVSNGGNADTLDGALTTLWNKIGKDIDEALIVKSN